MGKATDRLFELYKSGELDLLDSDTRVAVRQLLEAKGKLPTTGAAHTLGADPLQAARGIEQRSISREGEFEGYSPTGRIIEGTDIPLGLAHLPEREPPSLMRDDPQAMERRKVMDALQFYAEGRTKEAYELTSQIEGINDLPNVLPEFGAASGAVFGFKATPGGPLAKAAGAAAGAAAGLIGELAVGSSLEATEEAPPYVKIPVALLTGIAAGHAEEKVRQAIMKSGAKLMQSLAERGTVAAARKRYAQGLAEIDRVANEAKDVFADPARRFESTFADPALKAAAEKGQSDFVATAIEQRMDQIIKEVKAGAKAPKLGEDELIQISVWGGRHVDELVEDASKKVAAGQIDDAARLVEVAANNVNKLTQVLSNTTDANLLIAQFDAKILKGMEIDWKDRRAVKNLQDWVKRAVVGAQEAGDTEALKAAMNKAYVLGGDVRLAAEAELNLANAKRAYKQVSHRFDADVFPVVEDGQYVYALRPNMATSIARIGKNGSWSFKPVSSLSKPIQEQISAVNRYLNSLSDFRVEEITSKGVTFVSPSIHPFWRKLTTTIHGLLDAEMPIVMYTLNRRSFREALEAEMPLWLAKDIKRDVELIQSDGSFGQTRRYGKYGFHSIGIDDTSGLSSVLRRFTTVAHELGHAYLDTQIDKLGKADIQKLYAAYARRTSELLAHTVGTSGKHKLPTEEEFSKSLGPGRFKHKDLQVFDKNHAVYFKADDVRQYLEPFRLPLNRQSLSSHFVNYTAQPNEWFAAQVGRYMMTGVLPREVLNTRIPTVAKALRKAFSIAGKEAGLVDDEVREVIESFGKKLLTPTKANAAKRFESQMLAEAGATGSAKLNAAINLGRNPQRAWSAAMGSDPEVRAQVEQLAKQMDAEDAPMDGRYSFGHAPAPYKKLTPSTAAGIVRRVGPEVASTFWALTGDPDDPANWKINDFIAFSPARFLAADAAIRGFKLTGAAKALDAGLDAVGDILASGPLRIFHPTSGISPKLHSFVRGVRRTQQQMLRTATEDMNRIFREFTPEERSLITDVMEREGEYERASEAVIQQAEAFSSWYKQLFERLKRAGMVTSKGELDAYSHRLYSKTKREIEAITTSIAKRAGGGTSVKGGYAHHRGIEKRVEDLVEDLKPGDKVYRMVFFKEDPLGGLKQASVAHVGEAGKAEALKRGWVVADEWTLKTAPKDGKATIYRDYTRAERQRMGEVRDAVARFSDYIMQVSRDLSLGEFYVRIRDEMPDMISDKRKEGWKYVPDIKIGGKDGLRKYGVLTGKWVHPDVFAALNAANPPWRNTGSATLNKAIENYLKGLRAWKIGHVALAPATQFHNFVSNISMAYIWGYNPARVVKDGIAEVTTHGTYFREALDAGLLDGGILKAEADLRAYAGDLAKFAKQDAHKSFSSLVINFLDKSTWHARRAYELGDEVFKLGVFAAERRAGRTPEQALEVANMLFFDYGDVPVGIAALRDFYIPFITYTYKAAPAMMRAVAKHPDRVAAMMGMLTALNTIAYRKLYGSEAASQESLERANLADYYKGHTAFGPQLVRLPWQTERGEAVFLDTARTFVGGDVFGVKRGIGHGVPYLDALGGSLLGSNPIVLMAAGLTYGKDPFTGRDITPRTWEASASLEAKVQFARDYVGFLANEIVPNSPFIPGTYSFDKIGNALVAAGAIPKDVGQELGWTGLDKDGQPVSTWKSISNVLGIDVRTLDLDRERLKHALHIKALLREEKALLRRTYADQRATEADKKAASERFIKQYQALAGELERLFTGE